MLTSMQTRQSPNRTQNKTPGTTTHPLLQYRPRDDYVHTRARIGPSLLTADAPYAVRHDIRRRTQLRAVYRGAFDAVVARDAHDDVRHMRSTQYYPYPLDLD